MSRRKAVNTENFKFVERLIEACGTAKPANIARMLNVSYQAAKNYLQGRMPDSSVLLVISQRTSYSIHWLVTGEGKKFVENTRSEDRPLLTDEMRAFIRLECLDLINELGLQTKESSSRKVVVLSSEEIMQEKVLEDSIAFSANKT